MAPAASVSEQALGEPLQGGLDISAACSASPSRSLGRVRRTSEPPRVDTVSGQASNWMVCVAEDDVHLTGDTLILHSAVHQGSHSWLTPIRGSWRRANARGTNSRQNCAGRRIAALAPSLVHWGQVVLHEHSYATLVTWVGPTPSNEAALTAGPVAGFEYEALLDRARDQIPEDISAKARWRLPEPVIIIEGANTIFRNFGDVVSAMGRDNNHLFQFLLKELGTSGSAESGRVQLKGRIPPKRIRERLSHYVKQYIRCNECSAPDTNFIKADRTTLLKCQACGATRPVRL